MKKKIYVLALSALLGLGTITTIASCGSGDSLGTVVADNIKFSRDAVKEIEVGETIDLADYVTVSPADCKWKIEAKTNNIEVKGTKVTGKSAGVFKVQIYAGAEEMLKSYTGTVISHELANIKKAVAKLEDGNYTAVLRQDESLLSVAWHNETYFASIAADDAENPIVDGLCELKSGKVAEFVIDGNWDVDDNFLPTGGTFTVEPTYCAPLDLYTLGSELTIEGDEFSDSEDTPDVVMSADALEAWAPTLVGIDVEDLEDYLSTTIANIYATTDENGNISLEFTTKSNKNIANLDITNIGTTAIAEVDAYVKAGTEPEQLKFEAFNALMTKGIEEKNYALKGTLEMGYYDDNKVWHSSTNANALSSLKEDWGIEPASFQAYVDGETYYSIDNATKDISGETVKDDTFYYIDGTYDAETAAYTWETTASTSEKVNSIWVNNLSMTQQGYTSHAAFAIGDYTEELLGSINWASVTTDKDGNVKATATPYGDEGHALALGMALVPQIGNSYAWMMSTLSSKAYPSAHWYDFFDRQEYVYNKADNSITINTTLDYIASSGGVYYGVRFIVEIGSVGTASIPAGYPDAAFAAPAEVGE